MFKRQTLLGQSSQRGAPFVPLHLRFRNCTQKQVPLRLVLLLGGGGGGGLANAPFPRAYSYAS